MPSTSPASTTVSGGSSGERARPETRSAYRAFVGITTRWMDNDVYGHVNNVVYHSYFDTAVNGYLIAKGALDIAASGVVGLVVDTGCRYLSPIAFPDSVAAGIRVGRLGTTSVRYEIGLFREECDSASAQGHFVHVYVDRSTRRPVPLPDALRAVLAPIVT